MLHLAPQRSHPPQLGLLVVGVLLKQPQMLLLRHFLLLPHPQAPQLLLLQQTGDQKPNQEVERPGATEGRLVHLGGQEMLLAVDLLLLPGCQLFQVAQRDVELSCGHLEHRCSSALDLHHTWPVVVLLSRTSSSASVSIRLTVP